MTNVATSWIRDLTQVDDSGTSFTTTDDKVNIQTATTAGGDRAFIYKRLAAFPGEVITVKFRAKVISGSMGASVDYPSSGTSVISKTIAVSDWQTHTLTYCTPDTATAASYYQIAIGQYTGFSGECEIADVQISVENNKLPTMRAYAGCLLEIASGVVSVNESFSCVGIDRDDIDGLSTITTSMTINVPAVGNNNASAAPIFYASTTNDNASFYKVIVKAGQYNRATGAVTFTFIDSTNGNAIDISSLGTGYVWILAFGI